jgi:hypothetical protein
VFPMAFGACTWVEEWRERRAFENLAQTACFDAANDWWASRQEAESMNARWDQV